MKLSYGVLPIFAVASFAASSCFATQFAFTTLNYTFPNGTTIETDLTGINDSGQIVGNYDSDSGFEFSSGTFKSLGIYAGGINNFGEIAGSGYGVNGEDVGVIINGPSVTTFTIPGSVRTLAYQINDFGVVAGYYTTSGGVSPNGFEYNGTSVKTIAAPGATFTFLSGLNNSGDAVGEYGISNTLVQYFYDGSVFTSIDVPGSSYTEVRGVGNNGEIVGLYGDSKGFVHGFIEQNGAFSTVDVPGAYNTIVTGVNDYGVIVGSYDVSQGTFDDGNGFIGTPVANAETPEPSSAAMLIGASIVLASVRVSTRRCSRERNT